jgi:hypothetical protein
MSGFALYLPGSSLGFGAYHGNARAIHLHVENRDALPQGDGQVELQRSIDVLLLVSRDIFSHGFGGSLDRLGGDGEAS